MEVIANEFFSALKIVLKYGYIFFSPLVFALVGFSILIDRNYFSKLLKNFLWIETALVAINIVMLLV